MIGFTPQHPIVENLLNGKWRFVEPLFFDHPDGRSWMIPKGFETDWGSVPEIVDWIIPSSETVADPAYALHDLLYWYNRQGYPRCRDRKDADEILYTALLICGVGRVKAAIIYWAVRAGGWKAWGR